jgi:hypothetical protein
MKFKSVYAISDICSAFDKSTVGTKVMQKSIFLHYLGIAIQDYDVKMDRTIGQHVVDLTAVAFDTVSGGTGMATDNPDDYCLRTHRGKVSSYLKRPNALPVESLKVVVYTRDAYLGDPDVDETEAAKIHSHCTHVIVAVLAGAKASKLSPYRFVHNLAGGNKDYTADKLTVDGIIAQAKEILGDTNQYSRVAD